jgi:uncharacterized protein
VVSLIKQILVMLLGWIGFTLFKKIINPAEGNKVSSDYGQKMVACAVCDTHIPESEAIIRNGKTYCSKEHSE